MKNYLEYKGYRTRIEFDPAAKLLHGKIEGISDLVTFESTDTAQIENEFHAAVDDYLDFCKEIQKNTSLLQGCRKLSYMARAEDSIRKIKFLRLWPCSGQTGNLVSQTLRILVAVASGRPVQPAKGAGLFPPPPAAPGPFHQDICYLLRKAELFINAEEIAEIRHRHSIHVTGKAIDNFVRPLGLS